MIDRKQYAVHGVLPLTRSRILKIDPAIGMLASRSIPEYQPGGGSEKDSCKCQKTE
jgi:hypothetical protein